MIKLNTEILNKIEANEYYDEESFISDCKSYIKAVQSGRILYTVTSVSQSGMSRTINISSYEGTMTKGYYRNYINMLETLGYKFNKNYDIKVRGCGMNMLFSTNYNIIYNLFNMGFITKAKRDSLSQKVN